MRDSHTCTLNLLGPVDFKSSLATLNSTHNDLQTSLCNNIKVVVAHLAKKSKINYSVDPEVLHNMVSKYLYAHPEHTNPLNIQAKVEGGQFHIQYYDLLYGIAKLTKYPLGRRQGAFRYVPEYGKHWLAEGKTIFPDGRCREGKWHYVHEINVMSLSEGKRCDSNGRIYEGKWQYIHQLNQNRVIEGKITESTGEVYEGQWKYVNELGGMRLSAGKASYLSGVVSEGQWQYIDQLKRVALVSGTRTMPNGDKYSGVFQHVSDKCSDTEMVEGTVDFVDGHSEKGQFSYIPALNKMKLVNGISRNTKLASVQVGAWVYSEASKGMVFTPPTPKLPESTIRQIRASTKQLVDLHDKVDEDGKLNKDIVTLKAVTEQAVMVQSPEQLSAVLQELKACYTTLTRTLSLLTHPDKVSVDKYKPDLHRPAFEDLVRLRREINSKVQQWATSPVK